MRHFGRTTYFLVPSHENKPISQYQLGCFPSKRLTAILVLILAQQKKKSCSKSCPRIDGNLNYIVYCSEQKKMFGIWKIRTCWRCRSSIVIFNLKSPTNTCFCSLYLLFCMLQFCLIEVSCSCLWKGPFMQ